MLANQRKSLEDENKPSINIPLSVSSLHKTFLFDSVTPLDNTFLLDFVLMQFPIYNFYSGLHNGTPFADFST